MTDDPRSCIGCMADFGFCAVHGARSIAGDAATLADARLSGDRLAHSRGVANRAAELVQLRGSVAPVVIEVFKALGYLHDIGYAAPRSGMHALDGATFLGGHTHWQWVCPHVAWHSTARWEYEKRCMAKPRVEHPSRHDHQLLWVADFTTSPAGETVSAQARVDDIRGRYSSDSPVVAALEASLPSMNEALLRVGVDDRVRA